LSTEPEKSIEFEVHIIPPKNQWFDPIGVRFFQNTTDRTIKIGFSHNIRAIEVIAFIDPSDEDLKKDTIQALKGEIVEEEDYGGE
jgi:hypothetical protein